LKISRNLLKMIQNSDIPIITRKLGLLSGIDLSGKTGISDGYQYLEFHTTTTPPQPDGFAVRITLFWKRIEISFIPDTFARNLIESMGKSPEGNSVFSALADSVIQQSGSVDFKINDKPASPVRPDTWDTSWKKMELKINVFSDGTDPADFQKSGDFIVRWGSHFLNMILSLIPVEEEAFESAENKGLPEGAVTRVSVNRYERNPLNRSACIAIHGCYCHVCNLDFKEKYGDIGEGFIHVHHVKPVSQLGKDYLPDPCHDLIPVCPNCHAMLHRRNPPMTIEELKKLIKK